jgi:DNA-binding Lrp family transcriptional regulator
VTGARPAGLQAARRPVAAGRGSPAAPLDALVRVQLKAGMDPDRFESQLSAAAGVTQAWRIAGDCDFEVLLSCPNLAGLDSVLTVLRSAGGITATTLVLHCVRLDAR